jgi:hypothetical protein
MTYLKTLAGVAALLSLTACDLTPGPSVPFAAGQTMDVARAAVDTCAVYAPRGGTLRVRTAYASTILYTPLGLLIPAVVGTAISEPDIRDRGEAAAVDRCLKTRGFSRRDLTPAEMLALDTADITTRSKLLDHFVMGGQLETFTGT